MTPEKIWPEVDRRHARRRDERWTSVAKFSVGLVTGSITTAVATLSYVERLIEKTSKPLIEARVAGVEAALNKHLAEVGSDRTRMFEWVERQQQQNRMVLAKLDALCRAVPSARCPLGANDK